MGIDSRKQVVRSWWRRLRTGTSAGRAGGPEAGSGGAHARAVTADERFPDRPRFPASANTAVKAAAPPIICRPYRPGDEQSIMKGFNEVFQLCRDTVYWRWKFCRDGPPPAMLAVDAEGRVQAQFAGVAGDWLIDGTRVPVIQICDVFARRDPVVVRGNVMRRTMQAFYAELPDAGYASVMFGFPNRTALKLHVSAGPTCEGAQPVGTCRRAAGGVSDLRPVEGVERAAPSREALNALWERARMRYGCAAPRDAGWFQWRFQDRPDVNDYIPLGCWRGDGSLAAWLVLRRDGDTLWLCDLVWDGVSTADLERLDAAVGTAAARLAVRESVVWLQGDEAARSVLLGRGWRDRTREQSVYLAMNVLDPALDPQQLYARLYLTAADSDLI